MKDLQQRTVGKVNMKISIICDHTVAYGMEDIIKLIPLFHQFILHQQAGLGFTDCAAPDPAESLTLREVITELLLDEGKPILGALQCGHIMPTMSLPLGVNVNLDATNRTLRVLEY